MKKLIAAYLSFRLTNRPNGLFINLSNALFIYNLNCAKVDE